MIVVSTYSHTGPLGAMTARNSAPNGTSCGTEGWETTSYSTQLANQSVTGSFGGSEEWALVAVELR